MQRFRRAALLPLGVCLCTSACNSHRTSQRTVVPAGPSAPPVVVSAAPPENGFKVATSYSVQQGPTTFAVLSLSQPDPPFSPVLRFTVAGPASSCSQRSASTDFGTLHMLLRSVFEHEPPQPRYTLYTCYHEIDDRLPGLAAASPAWTRLSGERNVTLQRQYKAITDLLLQSGALNELAAALAPLHYQVRLSSGDLETLWSKASDLREQQRRLLPAATPPNEVLPAAIGKTFLLTQESH